MASGPILIHGLCKRTGTNYLSQLLLRHPATAPARPIWENFVVNEADRLVEYAARTKRHWPARWGDLDEAESDLLRHVGDGALRFLIDRADGARLVAKTPSVRNIGLMPRLFSNAHVIVLVRDGRSTAASLAKGFDWSLERSMRTWARGASEAKAFLEAVGLPTTAPTQPVRIAPAADGLRLAVVRYEDFVDATHDVLDPLLRFCDLDAADYEVDAAADIKVYASSFDNDDSLHWKGATRSAAFDPTSRFGDWSADDHDRFDAIAGDLNAWFGYDRSGDGHGISHRVADVVWPAKRELIRVAGKLESLRRR